MNFQEALRRYLAFAPLPLAIERSWEIELMSESKLKEPVLDLGCGEGLFAKFLPGSPFEFGLDPNSKELEKAKEYAVYRSVINSGGASIPLRSGSISTVFSNSTLEHVCDLDSVVKEVHRVLKPEGRFIITVPSDKFDHFTIISLTLEKLGLKRLAKRYRKAFNWFWAHYNYKNSREWADFFTSFGFIVTQATGYGKKWNCVLNELFVPLSVTGFINKKTLNKWTISTRFKSMYMQLLIWILIKIHSNFREDIRKSGLIYFELTKVR